MYDLFVNVPTDEEAPGYSGLIKNPIALSVIKVGLFFLARLIYALAPSLLPHLAYIGFLIEQEQC